MDKPERIILSTPKGLEAAFLERLQMMQDVDVVMMVSTAPPSGLCGDSLAILQAEYSLSNVIRWHEGMTFVAQEEKSLQPTNPYFGKEKWKKNRK